VLRFEFGEFNIVIPHSNPYRLTASFRAVEPLSKVFVGSALFDVNRIKVCG
jgi:hypothetical protein